MIVLPCVFSRLKISIMQRLWNIVESDIQFKQKMNPTTFFSEGEGFIAYHTNMGKNAESYFFVINSKSTGINFSTCSPLSTFKAVFTAVSPMEAGF